MPRFEISAGENGVAIQLQEVGPTHTQDFALARIGMGMSVASGHPAEADSIDAVCTGKNGAPAVTVIADEDGLMFSVSPAPPTGPATIGPLAAGESADVAAGGEGSTSYTVTVSRQ